MSDVEGSISFSNVESHILASEAVMQHQEVVDTFSDGWNSPTGVHVTGNNDRGSIVCNTAEWATGSDGLDDGDLGRRRSSIYLDAKDGDGPVSVAQGRSTIDNVALTVDTRPSDLVATLEGENYPYYDLDYVCSYAFQSEHADLNSHDYGLDAFIHGMRLGPWPLQSTVTTSPPRVLDGQSNRLAQFGGLQSSLTVASESPLRNDVGVLREANSLQGKTSPNGTSERWLRWSFRAFDGKCNLPQGTTRGCDTLGVGESSLYDVDMVLGLLCTDNGIPGVLSSGSCGEGHTQKASEICMGVMRRGDSGSNNELMLFPRHDDRGTGALTNGTSGAVHQRCSEDIIGAPTGVVNAQPLRTEEGKASGNVELTMVGDVLPKTFSCPSAASDFVGAEGPLGDVKEGTGLSLLSKALPISAILTDRARGRVGTPSCNSLVDSLIGGMEYPYFSGLKGDSNLIISSPLPSRQSICTAEEGEGAILSAEGVSVGMERECEQYLQSHISCSVGVHLRRGTELRSINPCIARCGDSRPGSTCRPVSCSLDKNQVVGQGVCMGGSERLSIQKRSREKAVQGPGRMNGSSISLVAGAESITASQSFVRPPAAVVSRKRCHPCSELSTGGVSGSHTVKVAEDGMCLVEGRSSPIIRASRERQSVPSNRVRLIVLNHKTGTGQNDVQTAVNLRGESTLEVCPPQGLPHFFSVDEYLECTDDNDMCSVTLAELQGKFLRGMNVAMFVAGSESVPLSGWCAVFEVMNHVFRDINDECELFMSVVLIRQESARDLLSESEGGVRTLSSSVMAPWVAFENVTHMKLKSAHHFITLLSRGLEVADLKHNCVGSRVVLSVMLKQIDVNDVILSSMLVTGGATPNDLDVLLREGDQSARKLFHEALGGPYFTVVVSSLCERDRDLLQLLSAQHKFTSVVNQPCTVGSVSRLIDNAEAEVAGCSTDDQIVLERKQFLLERIALAKHIMYNPKGLSLVVDVEESVRLEKRVHCGVKFDKQPLPGPQSSSVSACGGDSHNAASALCVEEGQSSKQRQEPCPKFFSEAQWLKPSSKGDTRVTLMGGAPPSSLPQRNHYGEGKTPSCLPCVTAAGMPTPRDPRLERQVRSSSRRLSIPVEPDQASYATTCSMSDPQRGEGLPSLGPLATTCGMELAPSTQRRAHRCFPSPASSDHTTCAYSQRLFSLTPARGTSHDAEVSCKIDTPGVPDAEKVRTSTTPDAFSCPGISTKVKYDPGLPLPSLKAARGPPCSMTSCFPFGPILTGPPVVVEPVEHCGISQGPALCRQREQPRLPDASVACSGGSPSLTCKRVAHASQNSVHTDIKKKQISDGGSDSSARSAEGSEDDVLHSAMSAPSKVRTLVVVDQGCGHVIGAGNDDGGPFLRTGGSHEGYEVDEVVKWGDGCGDVPSKVLGELFDVFVLGCNAAILTAESGSSTVSSTVLRGLVRNVLSEVVDASGLQNSKRRGLLSLSIVKLSGERMLDLLDDSSEPERLVIAMSPIFGPCVHNARRFPVSSCSGFDSLLASALRRAKNAGVDDGLVFVSVVLKQKLKADGDVLVSSLAVSLAGENVDLYTSVLNRVSRAPRALFHYALGGPCYTVALLSIDVATTQTENMLRVQKCIGEVVNRPIHRGSIVKFISGIRDDLVPSLREKFQGSNKCEPSDNILYRLEEMVRDAELLLENFESNDPRAYLSDKETRSPKGCVSLLETKARTGDEGRVHSLLFFEQRLLSDGTAGVQGNSVFTRAGAITRRYGVDEVVLRGPDSDSNATLCSRLLDELVRKFMSGHCTAVLAADSHNSASTPLILRKIVYLILQSTKAGVGCGPVGGDLFLSMALVKNGVTVDLLAAEESEAVHRFGVEISPLFDRHVRGVSHRVVADTEAFDRFLVGAVEHVVPTLQAEDPGLMVVSLKLTHHVEEPVHDVFVSSLMVTTVFDHVSHYSDILSNRSSELTDLFKLALGGPCFTIVALGLCDEDDDAEALLSVQAKLSQVRNLPSHRTSALRRMDELTKTIQVLGVQLQEEESEEEKAQLRVRIVRARRFLLEVESLLKNPPREMGCVRAYKSVH